MAKPSLAGTLDFLRRLAGSSGLEDVSDGALVDAFVRRRDEAAFTAIVRRHGPMVHAVCRRVLRDHAAAEDAFQATFLVLARKAASLRKGEALGSYLHGVALRVALRAKSRAGRTHSLDADVASDHPQPSDDGVRAVIDEELDRLPEEFRAPLVLCYLEGLTVSQAARRLGWTVGTVRGRLWRGRKRLRSRLLKRGVGAAGLFVFWALSADTAAAGSCALANRPSNAAARLAEGVVRAMAWKKLKRLAAVVAALIAFAGAAVMLSRGVPADKPADPPPAGALAEDGQLLPGKFAPVRALAVSADGKLLAAGCGDRGVVFWDLPARKEAFVVNDLPDAIECLAFHPDGKTLAAAVGSHPRDKPNGEGAVVLIDVAGRKVRDTVARQQGVVRAVAYSPDGQTFAAGGTAGGAVLYDTAGKELHHFGGLFGYTQVLAFSPDGGKLAAGVYGSPPIPGAAPPPMSAVWDVKTRKELFRPSGPAVALAFTPDGKGVAGFGSATVLDAETGKVLTDIGTGIPQGLAFSPAGNRVVVAFAAGLLAMYNTSTGRAQAFTRKARGSVATALLTADGKHLVTAGAVGDAGVVQLWDPTDDRRLYFHMPAGDGFGMALSPDGKTAAVSSGDNVLRYDLTTGNSLPTLTGHAFVVWRLAFSPDGKTLASASEDWSVRLWDLESGKERLKLGQSGATTGVAFSPDGTLVATASGGSQREGDMWRGEACLWDAATGKKVRRLKGHTNIVHDVAFFPDGKTAATSSYDQTVKLWDVATGQDLATLTHGGGRVYTVAVSPDGKLVASAGQDGLVKLWDTGSRKEIAVLKGHADAVLKLAFSPDGKWLASNAHDGTARLWDLAAKKEKHVLRHGGRGYGVEFLPGGKLLATSGDGLLRLWDVSTGEERPRP